MLASYSSIWLASRISSWRSLHTERRSRAGQRRPSCSVKAPASSMTAGGITKRTGRVRRPPDREQHHGLLSVHSYPAENSSSDNRKRDNEHQPVVFVDRSHGVPVLGTLRRPKILADPATI